MESRNIPLLLILFIYGNEAEEHHGLRKTPVFGDPIKRVKELTNYTRQWVKDNMVRIIYLHNCL